MPTQEICGENPFSLGYKRDSETEFEQELENEFDQEIRVQFDRRFEKKISETGSQRSDRTITESQNQSVPNSQVKRDEFENGEVSSFEVPSSRVESSQYQNSQVKNLQVPCSRVRSSQVPSSQVQNSQVPSSKVPCSRVQNSQVQSSQVQSFQVPNSENSNSKVPGYTTYKPKFIQPRPSTTQNDQNLKKYNWRVLSLEASDTEGENSPLPESRPQSQRENQNFPKKPEPIVEFSESRESRQPQLRPDIDIARIWHETNHSQPLSTSFLKEVTTNDCKTLLRIYDMLKVSNTRELELKIAILLKNRDSLQSKLNTEIRDCEEFRRENVELRNEGDDLADVVECKRKKYEKLEDDWFDLRDDKEDLEQALGDAVRRLKRYESKTSVGEFYYQGLAKRRKPESRKSSSPEDYRKSESASKTQRNHLNSIGDSYDSDRMKFNKKWEKYPETAVDRRENDRQKTTQKMTQQDIFKINSKSDSKSTENNEKYYVRSSPKIICSKEKQFLGDYLKKNSSKKDSKKDVTKAFSENKPVDSDTLINNYVRINEETVEKQQKSSDEDNNKPISIQTFELQNITKNIVNNINTTNSTPNPALKLSDLTGAHNKTINEIPLNTEIKMLAEIENSQKFPSEIEKTVSGELKNVQEKYLKGENSKSDKIKVKEKVFSVLSEVGGKKVGFEYRVKLSDCEAVGQGKNRSVAKGYAYLMFLWKLKKRLGIFEEQDVPEVGSFTLDIDNF